MKDILILTNFCSDFSLTDNDRFLYLAKKLNEEHQVEIVTSEFCHEKKTHRRKTVADWPFKISFLQEPGYKRNVCLKRFLSHFLWGINVKKYLENRNRPDVIYCAIPSLTAAFFAARYCEKNNIRFIIDVQDLWPEAFQMIINIPILSPLIFSPFTWIVNNIYKRADEVIAVSQTYVDRVMNVNKKTPKGIVVFLGTDIEKFDLNCQKKPDLEKEKFWLGYCGTLGSSYDLTSVFDALEIIKNSEQEEPHLVIMGDGPLMERFQEYAEKKSLNCTFTGRLPYNDMCALLKRCDVAVNPIMHQAAQSIINKHADYVSAGIPIISTQENKEFRDLVDYYHMGINCENGNAKQISEAILFYMNNETERTIAGINARRCAEERFDRRNTYNKIIEVICN